MSNQITTSMVKQYGSNVYHLVQQKGSRLLNLVDVETQQGEEQFFEQIGAVDARERVGRHSKVIYSDTPHYRRKVMFRDFYYADMCDKEDKLRTIIDPTNQYAVAARMALARKIDDEIISAMLGTAYTGKDGSTTKELTDANKLAAVSDGGNVQTNLNVDSLRKAKKYFWDSEAVGFQGDGLYEDELVCVVDPSQLEFMLGQEKVTSMDYNSVKALVQGDVNTFMGFKFIRTTKLPVTDADEKYDVAIGGKVTTNNVGVGVAQNSRKVIFFQRFGMKAVMPRSIFTRITPEMAEYHYNTQIYAAMSFGATRMEEERVLLMFCKED
jgi:hypothetical protein